MHDLSGYERCSGQLLYLEIHRKDTSEKGSLFANESHPFFASRSLGQWVLPVTYKLLSEFLCLSSQVCSILKSVGVPAPSLFSRCSSAGHVYFKFPMSVRDATCTGSRTDVWGRGQVVGQERLVLVPPVPSLSCAT